MSPRIHVLEPGWDRAQVARALAAEREDPFFVFDAGEVAARLRRWRALLPRVEPFYAVKCNDDPLLLRTLAALGTGFDCASRAEIEAVINLPVAPERIIFAHPTKLPSHLQFAAATGVSLTTFDSAEELGKIKQLMPNAQLLLRVRCDSRGARLSLGAKFGCEGEEAPRLLELAAKMDLDVAGIAFHVGSDTSETEPYARGIRAAAALWARAAALGLRPRLLDIGGGFQGHSHSDIKEPSSEAPARCTLWGPTCDALDCVVRSARLPALGVGSWLLFHGHGAYCSVLQTAFNGFPRARVFGFVDRKLWAVSKDLSPFTESDFQLDESEVKKESEECTRSVV